MARDRSEEMRGRFGSKLGAVVLIGLLAAIPARAMPPAQRLPSAILVYPLIVVEGGGSTTDTLVELVNLSSREQRVRCFYVSGETCGGFGFFVTLTPNQPMAWLASRGTFNMATFTAVPPFSQTGELKCAVIPSETGLEAHNAIQGRAIVFEAGGQTFGYGAVGFERLTPGDFSNIAQLDGVIYAQCPEEMHFVILASDPGDPATESELVLATCSEDLQNLIPTSTTVQIFVVNEFEQVLSASTSVTCFDWRRLDQISHIFTRATLGTDTGHVTIRGVQLPVLGIVLDRFLAAPSVPAGAANEPAMLGGRSATIKFP